MGMNVGGAKGGAMSDINVTPLVDVVLVLLIIFMVVTPMLSSGVDVKLPSAKTTTSVQDNGQHLVVSIRDDGVVFVASKQVAIEALIDEVNAEYRKDPNRAVLIKADNSLFYGQVREVMDVLNEGGLSTMLLAAEKLKDEG
jgi:biopolymer transport protein TolR